MELVATAVATHVTIAVVTSGGVTQIDYYPKRRGDTVVFHTSPGNTASPVKPRAVCWHAIGLAPGQRLVMGAKKPGSGIFDSDQYEIAAPNDEVFSSEPNIGPNGPELAWDYNVSLYDGASQTPTASLDPTVIIKEDP
jgi:hypothetical protein